MDDNPWFVVEDPDDEGDEVWDFDVVELDFVAALRKRAASWRVPPARSGVGRPEDESSLLVHISLSDDERRLSLGEWAVHFYGAHVRAGRVRDQLFNLDSPSGGGGFSESGSVEELADRCARWFESLLSRPVSRTEWVRNGKVHATSWEFADTQEGLVLGHDTSFAPALGAPRTGRHRVLVRGRLPKLPQS